LPARPHGAPAAWKQTGPQARFFFVGEFGTVALEAMPNAPPGPTHLTDPA
jgi:hypothetical protein